MARTLIALTVPAMALAGFFATTPPAQAQDYCTRMGQSHQQLVYTIRRCQGQMNQQLERMRIAAPQGIVIPPAPCQDNMPQWIAQLRYVEAQLGHCQGDTRSLCEQQGYPRGCEAWRNR